LSLVAGDDELAAFVIGQAVPGAVLLDHADAAPGHPRLGRAGLVVDAGVHDTGVVAGLVLADLGFLLEDGHRDAGLSQQPGRREPDDAGPNNPYAHNQENLTAAVLIQVWNHSIRVEVIPCRYSFACWSAPMKVGLHISDFTWDGGAAELGP